MPDQDPTEDGASARCIWCGAPLGQNAMPPHSAQVFCSRRCEIDGNFWLYQELLVIEITHPQDSADSP